MRINFMCRVFARACSWFGRPEYCRIVAKMWNLGGPAQIIAAQIMKDTIQEWFEKDKIIQIHFNRLVNDLLS